MKRQPLAGLWAIPGGGEIEILDAGMTADGLPLYQIRGSMTWRDMQALAVLVRRTDASGEMARWEVAASGEADGWVKEGADTAPDPSTQEKASAWMRSALEAADQDGDDKYSDCNGSTLAEDCACALGLWADDAVATIPEWVFDLAHEVGEWWEQGEAGWREDCAEDDNENCDDEGW